jgi:pectate lyase
MRTSILFLSVLLGFQAMAQTPNFSLTGFATTGNGTTGGTGGTIVTVSTYADLKKYAETVDTKYIIQISGTITGAGSVAAQNYQGSIRVRSNKTIVGLGNNAFLDGVGLSISGNQNIIIQNIKFSFISIGKAIPAGSGHIPNIYDMDGDEGRPQILVNAGDLISISGSNSNIWIDHCEFYEEDPAVQTNIDLYDGLIDIKDDSRYITISWCYFHDHHKCTLMGSSDTNIFPERKVTFHHNYYKKVGSRLPLIRGGIAHFFNNYTLDVNGVSNSRMSACVKSEKNYCENTKNVVYSSGNTGFAQVVDNKLVNSTTTTIGTCTADIPYNYSAMLTSDPNNVKSVVMAYAGVGKLVTGVEEQDASQEMQLAFPNPFVEQLSIQQKGAFSYQIIGLDGREMESGQGTDRMEVGANLSPNLYLLRVQSAQGNRVMKISKSK